MDRREVVQSEIDCVYAHNLRNSEHSEDFNHGCVQPSCQASPRKLSFNNFSRDDTHNTMSFVGVSASEFFQKTSMLPSISLQASRQHKQSGPPESLIKTHP